MNEVIKRYVEKVFVNYFSIIGIEIGSVRWDNDGKLNLCIVLFCLDEFILLYGEFFLFLKIENYKCDF